MHRTVIFPHVPKVAGTSILKQLESSGLRIYLDYDAPPDVNPWRKAQSERRNREARLLDFSAFDVVFGHFPIERYDGECTDRYRYVALVRDPVSRVESHLNYLFWRARHRPGAVDPETRRVAEMLASGERSVAQWVRKSGIAETYRLYLARWPRERFALVGDTSCLATFLQRLGDMLGIALDASVRERQHADPEFKVDEAQRRQLLELLRDEYTWYDALRDDAGQPPMRNMVAG